MWICCVRVLMNLSKPANTGHLMYMWRLGIKESTKQEQSNLFLHLSTTFAQASFCFCPLVPLKTHLSSIAFFTMHQIPITNVWQLGNQQENIFGSKEFTFHPTPSRILHDISVEISCALLSTGFVSFNALGSHLWYTCYSLSASSISLLLLIQLQCFRRVSNLTTGNNIPGSKVPSLIVLTETDQRHLMALWPFGMSCKQDAKAGSSFSTLCRTFCFFKQTTSILLMELSTNYSHPSV